MYLVSCLIGLTTVKPLSQEWVDGLLIVMVVLAIAVILVDLVPSLLLTTPKEEK
jgi:hypothetical protein